MTGPQPGWYDDGSGTQRYWHGERWTEETRSPAPPAFAPPMLPNGTEAGWLTKRRVALAAAFAVLAVVVILVVVLTAGSNSKPAGPSASDRLRSAYQTCSATVDNFQVSASHLSYSGGSISMLAARGTVDVLHCIGDALGAPPDFYSQLSQTLGTQGGGSVSDSFGGISATWSWQDNGGYGGYLNLQFFGTPSN